MGWWEDGGGYRSVEDGLVVIRMLVALMNSDCLSVITYLVPI